MTDHPRTSPVEASSAQPLAISDLRVALGGRTVVRGVDLTVRRGEFVVLLGSNGSGKSTLMRAALGLLPTHGGEVRLFGTPLRSFRDHARIGYVPQRSTAASGVPSTVREVVMSGRLARRRFVGVAGRADRGAVAEAISAVGMGAYAHAPAAELSGGQQQRVMIARGLVGDPDLLVLDEPTAGVDLAHQVSLATLFGQLLAEGRSIFMIAHELGPFEPLINRAVVLRDGRVAYDGPCSDERVGASSEPHSQHHPHLDEPPGFVGVEGTGAWPS
ncbi:zinc transport system ATP-binding protein [Mumia flava]|uniref:Zinc transport system ATP-binding protein n=1 Tax=Mumia flava TaxID=1348852 RepID=A0A2M9B803_9ACTN|nr:ABC transporter ATP-binding protein [Mumia flava]PJJ54062.1 zinc transport system ATP-binding protein [Mumia flava]